MANVLAYGTQIIGGGASSSSGGHTIVNASGTELTQQPNLKFKGGLKATNNATNSSTEIDDSPTEITWSVWQGMTPAQRDTIPKALITDVPGCDISIRADLMTTLWTNPSPSEAFAGQTITLSSSDYDMLLITYRSVTNHAYDFSCIINKGCNAILSVASSTGSTPWNILRFMSRNNSDTSYILGDAQHVHPSGSTVENNCAVPLVIYGIKKTIEFDFSSIASDVSTAADHCMLDTNTSVEDAIKPAKAYVGVCAGAAYNVITFGCMFPYSVSTATIKVISCLGMPDVEHVNIPCTVAKDAVTGTVAIFAAISDTTLMQNIRNYGTVACLEFTYN